MQKESLSALEKIPIRDNGEPLVDLRHVCPGITIALEPRRFKKEGSVFSRKSVAHMLKEALKLLPQGLTFKITDAWRPLKEQHRYYAVALSRLRKKHPDWPESQLRKELNKWIFPPDAKTPPWHTTGAAIDLTICDAQGRALPMKSKHKPLPAHIQKNRALLKGVMEKASFTNYEFEWWHFSYGDTGWALRTRAREAIYGAIEKS